MKVDALFVIELKREVNFQINRIKREVQRHGATDGRMESLYRLIKLKQLLNGLLNDGELVISGDGYRGEPCENEKESWGVKLARFFKMVNPDEID